MPKRILLITSVNTGSGHKSISDSLYEELTRMPDVEVKVIDGFDLAGRVACHSSGIYGMLTRHVPGVYNFLWKITDAHQPQFAPQARMIRRRFLNLVNDYKPDLILTVHSLFNTIITNLLKKNNLNVPVAVEQADLVSIHSTWCNPDAYMTICPTQEAFECSLKHNMKADRLKIIGFPVRSKFVKAAMDVSKEEYDPDKPIRILLMGGGEGSIGLKDYADTILRGSNAVVTIICGRNKKLESKLHKSLSAKYGERVRVLGFIDDIEYEMLRNDLLIARGSPNTLTEAVTLGIPIVMTGPFLDQERGNFKLVQDHDLGVVSLSPNDVLPIIESFIFNRGEKLKKIRDAQIRYRSFDNAYNIASFVSELVKSVS